MIEQLFAWVAVDPDGTEGVCNALCGEQHIPMIGADRGRMDEFREHAEIIAVQSGWQVILVQFGERRVIDDLSTKGSA